MNLKHPESFLQCPGDMHSHNIRGLKAAAETPGHPITQPNGHLRLDASRVKLTPPLLPPHLPGISACSFPVLPSGGAATRSPARPIVRRTHMHQSGSIHTYRHTPPRLSRRMIKTSNCSHFGAILINHSVAQLHAGALVRRKYRCRAMLTSGEIRCAQFPSPQIVTCAGAYLVCILRQT
ncbi:uncharacterized protein K489DRAFT_105714 [Dissoconium aciculare CBS 342.82]|uniref:Uncharacterized protein n=1 Tax=Dissoconium aciculare CBS 342.82 TaxID=1314786 RepID=A0A6J3MEN3_9PEZI|nr:uncharacterized protein K489DRAFT_105714 [Dissoconium aciculare CBS 342.82]KAF1826074.1 hypothetical protein K489DRAFT_105714 [Dissoconium aciculare CBS 342.82]